MTSSSTATRRASHRAWRAAEGVDSKFEQFADALAKRYEKGTAKDGKILVFSFFRKTIEHLARRLADRSHSAGGRSG